MPVAERWVCGLSLAGIAGSNSRRQHGCLLWVTYVVK